MRVTYKYELVPTVISLSDKYLLRTINHPHFSLTEYVYFYQRLIGVAETAQLVSEMNKLNPVFIFLMYRSLYFGPKYH